MEEASEEALEEASEEASEEVSEEESEEASTEVSGEASEGASKGTLEEMPSLYPIPNKHTIFICTMQDYDKITSYTYTFKNSP